VTSRDKAGPVGASRSVPSHPDAYYLFIATMCTKGHICTKRNNYVMMSDKTSDNIIYCRQLIIQFVTMLNREIIIFAAKLVL